MSVAASTSASAASSPSSPISVAESASYPSLVTKAARKERKRVRASSQSKEEEAASNLIPSVGDVGLTAEEVEATRVVVAGVEEMVPLIAFLDYSGSMNEPFKLSALGETVRGLSRMAEQKQSVGVVKIASDAQLLLRLGQHSGDEVVAETKNLVPGGETFLWEPIASYVQRCSDLGLQNVNLYVLTDGEDTRSRAGWKGVQGVIRLMELARQLSISVTVSIVQLGGSDTEQSNIRAAAGLTGGSYLHVDLLEADPDHLRQVLEKMSAFNDSLASTLGRVSLRDATVRHNVARAARDMASLSKSVSSVMRSSPDFASLEVASFLGGVSEVHIQALCHTVLQVLQSLVHEGALQMSVQAVARVVQIAATQGSREPLQLATPPSSHCRHGARPEGLWRVAFPPQRL